MELDQSAKVATLASVLVGILVSLTTWYTTLRIQGSQDAITKEVAREKSIGNDKSQLELQRSQLDASGQMTSEFSVPLARSFALQFKAWQDDMQKAKVRFVVPGELSGEITAMWPNWADRKGLMTGQPCASEGLLARQVVLLELKNEGHADVVDVRLVGRLKRPPSGSPVPGWRETGVNGPVAYPDLTATKVGWAPVEVRLPDLPARAASGAAQASYRVVLASVSGRTQMYGTVIVPLSVSWQDRMTGQAHSEPVLEPNSAVLNAELTGAEIGSLRDFCAKPA